MQHNCNSQSCAVKGDMLPQSAHAQLLLQELGQQPQRARFKHCHKACSDMDSKLQGFGAVGNVL